MRRPQPGPRVPWAAAVQEGRPIAELNMTPLIDVLLVLIVMFVMVIPAITHELPLDLPRPGPEAASPAVTHRVTVARNGAVALDGAAVSDAALARRLAALGPDAALVLRADSDARYERAVQVLAVVKRAGGDAGGVRGVGGGALSRSLFSIFDVQLTPDAEHHDRTATA